MSLLTVGDDRALFSESMVRREAGMGSMVGVGSAIECWMGGEPFEGESYTRQHHNCKAGVTTKLVVGWIMRTWS